MYHISLYKYEATPPPGNGTTQEYPHTPGGGKVVNSL